VTATEGSNAYLGSGQDIDAVLLKNTSSDACSISGYPNVSFFGSGASAAPDLQANYALVTAHMDVPTAFQKVTTRTLTDLEPGQSAAIYYNFNTRATSAQCAMQDAALNIGWKGSTGTVQFPLGEGAATIEACGGAQVTFSQIGPAATQLFVPDR
jgi:hypothetical protein